MDGWMDGWMGGVRFKNKIEKAVRACVHACDVLCHGCDCDCAMRDGGTTMRRCPDICTTRSSSLISPRGGNLEPRTSAGCLISVQRYVAW
ncbi:hypothetical protein BGY98DRAFT_949473, partial [Russula aff. rugulosa BPL654]